MKHKNERFELRLTAQEHAALKALADRLDTTKSEIVSRYIRTAALAAGLWKDN